MYNPQVVKPKIKNDESKKIKCVVWDLDNTIWDGILAENDDVVVMNGILDVIKILDSRGILQSVASKNDHNTAMHVLQGFGLSEYFLHPQINWYSKSSSVKKIAEAINIGLDTIAFIDDQPFEREEVVFELPEVRAINSEQYKEILDMPEFNPRFVTPDSKLRRHLYMSDIKRKKIEESLNISGVEFLSHLNMKLSIYEASLEDLTRVEELTERTNQLNTTGYTFSYEELQKFQKSEDYLLLINELEDKYGSYGKIGVTLIKKEKDVWIIKLLLMSCRVMSRGIGGVIISYVANLARKNNIKLRAEFRPTNKNRMMYVTYKFAGFKEIVSGNGITLLEHPLINLIPYPDYIELTEKAKIINKE